MCLHYRSLRMKSLQFDSDQFLNVVYTTEPLQSAKILKPSIIIFSKVEIVDDGMKRFVHCIIIRFVMRIIINIGDKLLISYSWLTIHSHVYLLVFGGCGLRSCPLVFSRLNTCTPAQ